METIEEQESKLQDQPRNSPRKQSVKEKLRPIAYVPIHLIGIGG